MSPEDKKNKQILCTAAAVIGFIFMALTIYHHFTNDGALILFVLASIWTGFFIVQAENSTEE